LAFLLPLQCTNIFKFLYFPVQRTGILPS
jgi:hypothetical protein